MIMNYKLAVAEADTLHIAAENLGKMVELYIEQGFIPLGGANLLTVKELHYHTFGVAVEATKYLAAQTMVKERITEGVICHD